MFVICSRVDGKRQVRMICLCIKSITTFHPNEKIVVVDSASPDKSYFEKIRAMNPKVIIEDINNKAYEAGAWWYVFDKYKKEKRYCFLQDSLILNESIKQFFPEEGEVYIFKGALIDTGWTTGRAEGSEAWAKSREDLCDYDLSGNKFRLAIWNCFLITNRDMKRLKSKRLNNILPDCKNGSCAYERMWGLAFKQEGYKMNLIPMTFFTKHFGGRQ